LAFAIGPLVDDQLSKYLSYWMMIKRRTVEVHHDRRDQIRRPKTRHGCRVLGPLWQNVKRDWRIVKKKEDKSFRTGSKEGAGGLKRIEIVVYRRGFRQHLNKELRRGSFR